MACSTYKCNKTHIIFPHSLAHTTIIFVPHSFSPPLLFLQCLIVLMLYFPIVMPSRQSVTHTTCAKENNNNKHSSNVSKVPRGVVASSPSSIYHLPQTNTISICIIRNGIRIWIRISRTPSPPPKNSRPTPEDSSSFSTLTILLWNANVKKFFFTFQTNSRARMKEDAVEGGWMCLAGEREMAEEGMNVLFMEQKKF